MRTSRGHHGPHLSSAVVAVVAARGRPRHQRRTLRHRVAAKSAAQPHVATIGRRHHDPINVCHTFIIPHRRSRRLRKTESVRPPTVGPVFFSEVDVESSKVCVVAPVTTFTEELQQQRQLQLVRQMHFLSSLESLVFDPCHTWDASAAYFLVVDVLWEQWLGDGTESATPLPPAILGRALALLCYSVPMVTDRSQWWKMAQRLIPVLVQHLHQSTTEAARPPAIDESTPSPTDIDTKTAQVIWGNSVCALFQLILPYMNWRDEESLPRSMPSVAAVLALMQPVAGESSPSTWTLGHVVTQGLQFYYGNPAIVESSLRFLRLYAIMESAAVSLPHSLVHPWQESCVPTFFQVLRHHHPHRCLDQANSQHFSTRPSDATGANLVDANDSQAKEVIGTLIYETLAAWSMESPLVRRLIQENENHIAAILAHWRKGSLPSDKQDVTDAELGQATLEKLREPRSSMHVTPNDAYQGVVAQTQSLSQNDGSIGVPIDNCALAEVGYNLTSASIQDDSELDNHIGAVTPMNCAIWWLWMVLLWDGQDAQDSTEHDHGIMDDGQLYPWSLSPSTLAFGGYELLNIIQ